jgi:hypothetical protein
MNQEVIEAKKKLLKFWQEEARNKTCEMGKAVCKANALQREIYELENGQKKTPPPPVS